MKLDKLGFKQLNDEIKKAEAKLNKAMSKKGASAQGNSTKDNFDYENATVEVFAAQHDLHKLREDLSKAELIVPHEQYDKADLGDIIELLDCNEKDSFVIKLNANYKNDINADVEIDEISISTPLGSQVFGKKVGEVLTYSVNSQENIMKIINIKKPTMTKNNQLQ